MRPINLADVTKNPKDVQAGLKEWDRANDAELIEVMQRRGELKHLKAASYDRVRNRITVGQVQADSDEGCGFRKGDRVVVSVEGELSARMGLIPTHGIVTGVRDGFIRVGKELYAPGMWRKK